MTLNDDDDIICITNIDYQYLYKYCHQKVYTVLLVVFILH